MIRFAGKDKAYKQLMDDSFMNLPDGTPLTWLGKLGGDKRPRLYKWPSTLQKNVNRKFS